MRTPRAVSVGALLQPALDAPDLDVEVIAGRIGLDRSITSPHLQKTGLALAGFDEYLRPGRILVVGCEPATVDYGMGLSDAVAASVDEAVRAAQRALWEELRVVAEPAGATGLAALMAGAYKPAAVERVATLVCGANTDPGSVA